MWPLGQAVKTPPFHGGNRGSIPLGVTILRSHSSAGRAPALQAGGHRFDPCCDHHKTFNGSVAQLVRVPACHAGGRGFEPLLSRQFWPLGQAVKTPPFHGGNRGSIPLGVTILRSHSSAGRAPALQAGGHRFDPCCDHHKTFNGSVAQLVRVPACHAGGRGFEPLLSRHMLVWLNWQSS